MTRAHVQTAGEGPAVILLHASGSSGRQWDALVARLRPRFRLHAVDLHGHGNTPAWAAPRPMMLEDETALVEPLLADAPGGVHLVGHSYGGAVAMKLAMRFPARVRSVAVYEPVMFRLLFDYNRWHAPAREAIGVARSMQDCLALGFVERAARRFIDYWAGEGSWDAMPPARRQSMCDRMHSIVPQFRVLFSDRVTRAELGRLPMPVLCLVGARTKATTRRIGELLRLALPNARHDMMAGLGHMGPITHAAEVNARLAAFLDEQAADAAFADAMAIATAPAAAAFDATDAVYAEAA